MATIDYKEKYEQALERARQFSEKPYLEDSAGIVEYIFQELAESEDERIREHLIGVVELYYGNTDEQEKKDCLAWLEKQGNKDEEILVLKDQIESLHAAIKALKEVHIIELKKQCEQKLVKCNMEWYDFVRWFVKERTNNYTLIPSDADIHTWGGIILEHAKKELEKQGKQKSVDKIQLGKKYKCIASPRYSTFRIGEIYKPEDKFLCSLMNFCSDCFEPIEGEQKPAYTKEYDFHGVKFIPKFAKGDIIKDKKCGEVSTIEDFSYDTGLYTHTYGQFPITIQDNYEIIEQESAWGKEDEKIIRRIDSLLYSQCKIHGSEYEEIHNWLKSLRPQNWKPSDEQMNALNYVVNLMASSERPTENNLYYNILKSLRQQLMKLKE